MPGSEARYAIVAGRKIRRFTRAEFLARRWRYAPGQHVAFLAPTQDGKTTLAYQLLQVTAKPSLPALVLVMKPRDPTPAAWTRALGFPEEPLWPPKQRAPWAEKPPGWTLWPKHTFNIELDNAHLSDQFARALQWAYQRGNCIVFADEVYGILAELDGLNDELIALWSRGGGMGTGLWAATQRPAGSQGHGVPGFMYSNSAHLFLSRDPDSKSRQRYSEIGGIDPKLITAAVLSLKRYEFFYITRGSGDGGPYFCIVEAR
jgi:hypothetical protein